MANNTKQLDIFTIWNDEIENRLDPFFYRPIFKKLIATISNAKRKAHSLGDIVEFSVAGDWGEDPNTFEPNPDYQLCYVLRNTNFDNKYNLNFDDVAQRYVKNNKVEKLALQKGEILIEKSGGSPVQPVGRVAFVEDLPFGKPAVFSNFLQKIRISGDSFLPEYVFTFLQTIYHLGYTEFLQNQTTGIKNLRLDDFLKIKIAELSKDEQKKIAKFAFDARRKAKNMEDEAQQVLASIDDFVLSELSIEIPEGGAERVFEVWSDEILGGRLDPFFYKPLGFDTKNFEELGKYAKVQGGYAFKSNEYIGSGIPLVRIQNLQDGEVDLKDTVYIKPEYQKLFERFLLHENDLLVAMTGATIGKTAQISAGSIPAFLNQRVGRFIISDDIDRNYLSVILKTRIFLRQITKLSLGGAQPNISPESIEKIKIPIPSLYAQKKIVSHVQSSYSKMRTMRVQAAEVLANAQKQVEQMILS